MLATLTESIPKEQPTMEDPAVGALVISVNDRRIELAEAEYWAEGGGYTVRSREFDCFATGETFDEALAEFGRAVLNYAELLTERVDQRTATEVEREALNLLADRLSRIFLEERRSKASRRRRLPWRRRGSHQEHLGAVSVS